MVASTGFSISNFGFEMWKYYDDEEKKNLKGVLLMVLLNIKINLIRKTVNDIQVISTKFLVAPV